MPIFNVRSERPTRQILTLENTRLSSLTRTSYERFVLPDESINENNLIEFPGYFAALKFVVKMLLFFLKLVMKTLLYFLQILNN